MLIYQFIKFNNETTYEHLMKFTETGAALCFDFEDSIYDRINPANSKNLKLIARENFDRIYRTLNNFKNIKTGVRINSSKDIEQEKDLISLTGKNINTIWIPKAENPQDILTVKEKLKSYHIICDEIIPIIETRTSL